MDTSCKMVRKNLLFPEDLPLPAPNSMNVIFLSKTYIFERMLINDA